MSQIATATKKLQLLEQTNEIEEEEREINARNVAKRTEKYKELKSQNDLLCLRSSTEMDLRQESNERKALLSKFKESIEHFPWMKPLAELLENNQGNLHKMIFLIPFFYICFVIHHFILIISLTFRLIIKHCTINVMLNSGELGQPPFKLHCSINQGLAHV